MRGNGGTVRRYAPALAAILVLAMAARAHAIDDACKKTFAGKTVKLIVPHAVGGGYDAYARLLQPFYEAKFGVKVVVRNETGAGGQVGALMIKDAKPDGLTIGFLNVPGLLAATLTGEAHAPNPATDMVALARLATSKHIWAVAKDSPYKTIDELMAAATPEKPLLFSTRDVGSLSFLNIALVCDQLQIPHRIVGGYGGSAESALAVIRGDVDVAAANFESILDPINAGELRVLLQISDKPISDHPALKGVPLLASPDGVAAHRAKALGRNVKRALTHAKAISDLLAGGRVVEAPVGLPGATQACLRTGLMEILTDPAFEAAAAKAKRSLDVEDGLSTNAEIKATADEMGEFLPIVREAVEELRN